jgi:peptide/nickel transport system substrate-binding protein
MGRRLYTGILQKTLDLGRRWPAMRRGSGPLVTALCLLAACGRDSGREASRDDALTVLLPRDVQELDPRYVGDAYGIKVSRLLFASLVTIDPHSLEAIPDLAERIETLSETTYRVTLRPDLHFSDGSTLDAEDVVATFRSVVDPRMATRYAPTFARIAKVDGPHATFVTDLEIPILRAEDAHARIARLHESEPIGAGPYRLVRREPGRIELRANPRWYAGAPHFPHLRLLVIADDNTRALRMLAGAADLALSAIPPLLVPLFEGRDGFAVSSARGIGTTYMGINTTAPLLRDVRVRRALAHAIDRATLVRTKFGGRAHLASTFVPEGHWAHDANVDRYDYDPAAAKALLDQAGLIEHAGQPRARMTLRCGNDRFRYSIARAIAAMLTEVGLEVDVRPTETATLIADLDRGQFELTMLQMPELIEPHVLGWFFGSERIPAKGREGANRWRFANAAFDAAIERGRAEPTRTKRIVSYREVQRLLASELPVIPLWHEDVVAVRATRAHAFVVPRDGRFSTLAR